MPGLDMGQNDVQIPPVKRQRVEQSLQTQQALAKKRALASRIFAPYRTVGLISPTSVPFTSIPLGKTTFQLTTSTGRTLHTYDLRRGLQLVFITKSQTPARITATYAWKDVVLAAWGDGKRKASNGGQRAETGIWIFKRGQKIAELPTPAGFSGPILRVQIFGTWLVTVTGGRIDVWKNVQDRERPLEWEHYTSIQGSAALGLQGENNNFTGELCTVPTVLNKVIVGKTNGSVEIWNVRTGRLIYTIASPTSKNCPVTALEPSPAIGVVAVARSDGSVALHDVIKDRLVLKVKSEIPVTTVSFRTDGLGAGEDGQKDGIMATSGAESGDVTLWDLNEGGRVQGVLRNAHSPPSSAVGGASGGISRIEFLAGQPVIVSSGLDNALKSWVFDHSPFNPVPRILHSRSGHAAPVTRLQFLPTQTDGSEAIGKWLISSGRDRSLWGWSLRRDGQSTEISQGNIQRKAKKLGFDGKKLEMDTSTSLEDLKAPEITCIACNLNRDGGMGTSTGGGNVWANVTKEPKDPHAPVTGWESMVTGHRGDKFARTWFWGRKKAGRWALETGDKTEVRSVAMSPCGTFALIGSAGGSIDMFNLQSGIHRQKFPRRLRPTERKALDLRRKARIDGADLNDDADETSILARAKHTRDVTGIVVDSMNRTVVSCGLDGKLKFWDFMTGSLSHEVDKHLSGGFTDSRYHRPSDLLALSCDDMSIQVVDIETRKTVRELWGCVGQVKDFCFSNDGRWIIAASMDSTIRVWDLPTGHLIDALKLDSVCTSLTFSPTGEFLATSHADGIGISIWSNRSLFKRIPTRHIREEDIAGATMPTDSGEGAQGLLAAAFEAEDEDEEVDDSISAPSVDQLNENMTTLSLVPRSRWQTLLHLDLISQRNKPVEPPKAPEKAPFFLPSLGNSTNQPQTNGGPEKIPGVDDAALTVTEAERSRISAIQRHGGSSITSRPFTALLHAEAVAATIDPEPVVSHLKHLNPAMADVEIRSLSPSAADSDGGPVNELAAFVRLLTARLGQRRDYEVVQAWMAVFLRLHGDVVANDRETRDALGRWREVAMQEQKRINGLVGYCGGVAQFLRSAR